MLTIQELAEIRESRVKAENSGLPGAKEGSNTKMVLPPGSTLPKFLGFTQAAEEMGGSARYDPTRHKMPFDEFKNNMSDIVRNGIANGKTQGEIITAMDNFQSLVGYTDQELNPKLVNKEAVKTGTYGDSMVNPFPTLKMLLGIGGSLGGTAGGAVTGARLGLFGGPGGAVLGGIIGGTLGYLSGLTGYEGLLNVANNKGILFTPTYNEIGEFMGYQQGIDRPTAQEFKEYLGREAAIDLAFGAGFGFFRPGISLLRPLGRKFLGVGSKEMQKAQQIADETGIVPGITDISKFEFIRSIPFALGRIPFFGGGTKKAFKEKTKAFLDRGENLFYSGPTFNLADLGYDLSKVRDKISRQIITNVDNKYNAFFDAMGNKSVFDISSAQNIAKANLKELANAPEIVKQGDMYRLLEEIANKPINMFTAKDWKMYRTAMNDMIYQYGIRPTKDAKEVRDALYQVTKEWETTLGKFADGSDIGANAAKLLKDADTAYSDMVKLFGSPTAGTLAADSKFAYQAMLRTPGSKETDRLFNVVFRDFNSPDAVKSMRRLMGDEMFAKGVKAKLLQSFEDSFNFGKGEAPGLMDFNVKQLADFDNLTFNSRKFKESLGITGKTLETSQSALKEALEIGGETVKLPTMKELNAFADAAEMFFNGKNLSMSQYLARRTMLGGTAGFITGAIPVATAGVATGGVGAIGTLLGIVAARYGGYLLSSPVALNAVTKALKESARQSLILQKPSLKGRLPVTNRAALEALSIVFREFPDLPDEIDNSFNSIQKRVDAKAPLAKDMYLAQQEEFETMGTMDTIDQFLQQRYGDKGLIVPDIFGSAGQQETPGFNVDPSVQEVPTIPNEVPEQPIELQAQTPAVDSNSRMALISDDPLLSAIEEGRS
jgi:hypothetical protein